jgi:nucleoside-diphosphate-sugar epimerase
VRILITGAAGFVASHLARVLRERTDARLIGVDIRDVPSAAFDEHFSADLSVASVMVDCFQTARPDLVFNLAGSVNGTDEAVYASNVDSARHLLAVAGATARATRIVLLGSAAEYGAVPAHLQPVRESYAGMPLGAYGKAKSKVTTLASEAAANPGLPVVVARPFNIVGAGIPTSLMVGAVVDRVREAIAGRPPRVIRIGSTTAIRDFVAVEDVVDGLIRLSERGRPGEAYNLCSGVGVSVADVVDRVIALAGERIDIKRDLELVRTGEVSALVGNWEKAGTELGWSPTTSLDASLSAAWEAAAPSRKSAI